MKKFLGVILGIFVFLISCIALPVQADTVGCLPGALFSSTTGKPCTAITTTTTCFDFTKTLTIGSSGSDVTALQNFLKSKGYLSADITGYFGIQTQLSLAAYQTAKGISPATGYFGVITMKTVNSDCGAVLSSPLISYLQAKASENNVIYSAETAVVYGTNLDGDAKIYIEEINKNLGVYQFSIVETGATGGKQITISNVNADRISDGDYYLYAVKSGIKSNMIRVKYINSTVLASLTVVSPNGGETFEKRKTYNISWTTKPGSNISEVQIGLFDTRVTGDTDEREITIAQRIPNTGSYSWTVPNSFGNLSSGNVEGKNYQIIVYPHGTGFGDASNDNFTIIDSTQTSGLTLTATQSTKGLVHVNASFDSNKYDSNFVELKATCPSGVTAFLSAGDQNKNVCGTVINMDPIAGPGAYQTVYIFKNNTGSTQMIDFQAGMDGLIAGANSGNYTTTSFAVTSTSSVKNPTATLTVKDPKGNDGTEVTVNTGDKIGYNWSSTNADKASSVYTNSCGLGGAWTVNTLNGSIAPGAVPSSYAGCVLTMTYTVTQNSTGATAKSTIKINVNGTRSGANAGSVLSRFLKSFGW